MSKTPGEILFQSLSVKHLQDMTYDMFMKANPDIFEVELPPQVEIVGGEDRYGWSWPVEFYAPTPSTSITVTIVARRKKRNNRGIGNSMRKKKRALSRYK